MNGLVLEQRIAETLGLPVVKFQAARKKMAADDWSTDEKGRVGYHPAVMSELLQAVTGGPWEKNAVRQLIAMATADQPLVLAKVWRIFRNPHVIEMRLANASDEIVTVRVRSNDHLKAGEQGTVLLLQREPDGRYELAQRLPRSRRAALQTTASLP